MTPVVDTVWILTSVPAGAMGVVGAAAAAASPSNARRHRLRIVTGAAEEAPYRPFDACRLHKRRASERRQISPLAGTLGAAVLRAARVAKTRGRRPDEQQRYDRRGAPRL